MAKSKMKPKKSILMGLVILILVSIGIFYYKDESRLKSVKVDDSSKYAEIKLKDDKVCNDKIAALNLSLDVVESSSDGTPTVYELACQPTNGAIKDITGSENVPVGFKVITSSLTQVNGSGDFACKKGGNSAKFKVTGNLDGAYLEIIPQNSFEGSKKANGSSYTCMVKKERGYGYVMFSPKESVGGLQDGKTETNPMANYQINLDGYDVGTTTDVKKDDENEHVDRIKNSTPFSRDFVQVNGTLQDDTADYTKYNKVETSRTFKEYLDAYEAMKASHPEKTYSAVLGENDDSVTNIKDGSGKDVSAINLACNYALSQSDVKAIIEHNFQDTYKSDGSAELTSYYYDSYDGDNNPVFNTTYFKGEKITEESNDYKWHLNTGNSQEETVSGKAVCKRKCTEVVKVDYGPPVAVKAGMCFEYRVKVSSIVQCESDTQGTTEPTPPAVCNPVPTCWSNAMKQEMKVAGPTEDFQACVNDCDGGKYTEACSTKCYEKVYGKTNKKVSNVRQINPSPIALQKNSDLNGCVEGQYYRYGKGTINWCDFEYQPKHAGVNWHLPESLAATANGRQYLYARSAIFYGSTKYTWPTYSGYYQTTTIKQFRQNGAAGILRGYYNGQECHDSCHWINRDAFNSQSCDGKYLYFDYGYYQGLCNILGSPIASECQTETQAPTYGELTGVQDAEFKDIKIVDVKKLIEVETARNMKIKKRTIEACEAATTCNQTESTYVINFRYTLKGDTTVHEEPPYSSESNKQTLINKGKENMDIKNNILLSYGGCYADTENLNRWYQAEWTIPGTWVKLKGNKISYKEPSDTEAWSYQRGKVCLPPNITKTNAAWATQFIKATEAINNATYTTDWKFNKDALNKVKTDPTGAYTYSNDKYEGYNIYAKSQAFGHFNWNFSISCFWSYTDEPVTVECEGNSCNENCGENGIECTCKGTDCEKKNSDEGYTVRSFNTNDPVLEGTGVQKKVLNEDRATPFNWSSGATMKYMKRGGYDINPEEYLNELKETDSFAKDPDVVVKLTKENINALRKYNKEHNKTGYNFEGNITSDMGTGVTYYISPIITQGEYLSIIGGNDFIGLRGKNNSSSIGR